MYVNIILKSDIYISSEHAEQRQTIVSYSAAYI